MSTSDQNGTQLTRKQLRELRLTGSTPVIDESAAAAAAAEPEPAPEPAPAAEPAAEAAPEPQRTPAPRSPIHHIVESPKAPVSDDEDEFALFGGPDEAEAELPPIAPLPIVPPAPAADLKPQDLKHEEQEPEAPKPAAAQAPLTRRQMRRQERVATDPVPTPDPADDAHGAIKSMFDAPVADDEPETPVVAEVPRFEPEPSPLPAIAPEPMPAPVSSHTPEREADSVAPAKSAEESRPMVGAAFGIGVKEHAAKEHKLPTAFDDLLDRDSAGATNTSSTLIFTPSPGVGSLSGPIASTGELLITGSYKLPEGLGSRGHARGTTDGKEVDAVLIDGELAPTSSPTPIAASSAISTLKPAGEVIRPPAPDKSSKLTFTLAIVAGGLGLALAVVIGVAASTGVFS